MTYPIEFSTEYRKEVNGYDHESNHLHVIITTKAGSMSIRTGTFYQPYDRKPDTREFVRGVCEANRTFENVWHALYPGDVMERLGVDSAKVLDAFNAWRYGIVESPHNQFPYRGL